MLTNENAKMIFLQIVAAMHNANIVFIKNIIILMTFETTVNGVLWK